LFSDIGMSPKTNPYEKAGRGVYSRDRSDISSL
jgi:hypothetical protein